MDPHSENYYSISPYAYIMNNPMKYVDPMGTGTTHFEFHTGKVQAINTGGKDAMSTILPEVTVKGKNPWSIVYQGGVYRLNNSARGTSQVIGEKPLEQENIEFWSIFPSRLAANAAALLVAGTAVEGSGATQVGRVFWSGGGNPAVEATARKFVTANGMTTLEMTRAGQNMIKLTEGMTWEQAAPMWQRISTQFAKGAEGSVHVFQNSAGVGVKSVWGAVEYPILKQNGVNIIYHNIIP